MSAYYKMGDILGGDRLRVIGSSGREGRKEGPDRFLSRPPPSFLLIVPVTGGWDSRGVGVEGGTEQAGTVGRLPPHCLTPPGGEDPHPQ